MATLAELQLRAWEWHTKRFPEAQMEHVGLKMGEEVGEVQKEINGLAGSNSATGGSGSKNSLLNECADVVIAALVLASRWCDDDLLWAVHRKLSILEDPDSGHRAAARRPT